MLRTPPPGPQVPVLETPCLRLRAQTVADFSAYANLWSEPSVTRYTTGRPITTEEMWARLLRNVAAKLGFTPRETVTYRDAPALLLTQLLD